MNPHKNTPEKFWARIDKSGECWIWTGGKTRGGYGTTAYRGKRYRTHRLAWELTNGPIASSDVFVCHRCDNPPCCNPAHLFLGTAEENVADMMSKGRGGKGPTRKLSPQVVAIMRAERTKGTSPPEIAKRFGVNVRTAIRAYRGYTWKDVIAKPAPVQIRKAEAAPSAKLDWCSVLEIRQMFRDGASKRRIAAVFGVNRGTVRRIVDEKTWKYPDRLDGAAI